MTRATLGLAAAAAVLLAACSDDNDNGPSDGRTDEYVSAVSATVDADVPVARRLPPELINGRWVKAPFQRLASALAMVPVQVTAVYHDGAPPVATGGLDPEGQLISSPLVGQPFRYAVEASGAFSIVYLMVEGLDGYYQLTLPAGVQQLELAVTLANTPPAQQFTMQTLLGYDGGVTQPLVVNLNPGDLATADVAIMLNWVGRSDVDLHVFDALGQHVYYGDTSTPEGGSLDLDSNPACVIDDVNQEIISWPAGTAPDGEYTVVVHLYDDCGVTTNPWTVRVSRTGHATETFEGTLSGSAGIPPDTVTTFTVP